MKNRARSSSVRWVLSLVVLLALTVGLRGQVPPPGPLPPGQLQPVHEKAAIISLSGEVDAAMERSLVRRIDVARKAGCTLIVYKMDTYGGILLNGMEISKLTKRLPEEGIHTVAWVNDKAYSAGALISAACEQIVMVHDGRIGDCAPIRIIGGNELAPMPAAERAKVASPVLQEFEDSATRNHYDKLLFWAMVVPEIEIHEVRNAVTGETRFVDTATKDKLLAEEVPAPGGAVDRPWKFVQTIDGKDRLLTVNAADALRMNLSKATIDGEEQLRTALNIRGELLVLDPTFADSEFVFQTGEILSKIWVRFLLFVAMIVLAVMESSHPGAVVPGLLSVLCLALLVGGPYISGIAQFWEVALIVLGVAIVALDLYFFGGIGFLAIPGFLLMAFGIVATFVPMEAGHVIPTLPGTLDAIWNGLAVVVFGTITALAAIVLLSRYIYMAPGFKRLQLAPAIAGAGDSTANVHDATDRAADDVVFVGAMGVAVTDLRPAGKVRFEDHLVDVASFGSFISRGSEVEVTSVKGNRVVVKPHVVARPQPPAGNVDARPSPGDQA